MRCIIEIISVNDTTGVYNNTTGMKRDINDHYKTEESVKLVGNANLEDTIANIYE